MIVKQNMIDHDRSIRIAMVILMFCPTLPFSQQIIKDMIEGLGTWPRFSQLGWPLKNMGSNR
jgi:hypothetical protein